MDLDDRVVVMSNGRIEHVGAPDEIYDRPATPFVHGFIGEGAALPVAFRSGVPFLGEMPLDRGWCRPGAIDERTPGTLFVRPEGLRLVGPGEGLFGTVAARSRVGGQHRIAVALGEGGEVSVLFGGEAPPAIGTAVGVRIERGAIFSGAAA